ncbi:hypothetical protein [Candidatus Ruthturnera calyptogenae]|uniref:hypothetical protein n=1 Tax=Candidatus Ruthturnera calyptogenae TaxID=386487 RepID=UPI0004BCEE41|nr:hypothetical protein [Candidatus Ruthturnera calyptogenae]
MGEIVTALSNTSNYTFESASVVTLMKKYMIKYMLDIVGFKNCERQMVIELSNTNMFARNQY